MADNREYILVFTTAYFPYVGGAEVALRDIARRLPHYHFDVVTARMSPNLPKIEEHNNITIHRLGTGIPFVDKIILAFYGPIYAAEFAHIHSYKLVWAMMASFGGLAASGFKHYHPQTPYLLTLQEGDDLAGVERKAKLLGPLFKNIFKRADEIQAISHYLMGWAHKMGAECPVRLIPNGVDLTIFSPRPKMKLPYKLIVTTSRLNLKNGVDTLIAAMTYLPEDHHLAILGSGPLKEELEDLVERFNLADRVNFLETLPQDQMVNYLAQADVFCRPSRSEGLGNSFLEAMAVGVPCIGTSVGGLPDFLINNQTGFVVSVDNPQELAKTISKVIDLKDAPTLNQITTNAAKLVKERYAIEVVVAQMEKLFSNIKAR